MGIFGGLGKNDVLIGITLGLGRNWIFSTGFTLNCSRETEISNSLEQFRVNPVEKVQFLPNPGVIPIKTSLRRDLLFFRASFYRVCKKSVSLIVFSKRLERSALAFLRRFHIFSYPEIVSKLYDGTRRLFGFFE